MGRCKLTAPANARTVLFNTVHANEQLLRKTLARYVYADVLMDDVIQETYLRLWRWSDGKHIDDPMSFAYTIGKSVAINMGARAKYRRYQFSDIADEYLLSDEASDLVRDAHVTGLIRKVQEVLCRFSEKHRNVYYDFVALDYTAPQIAQATGLSLKAVERTVERTRAKVLLQVGQHKGDL